MKPLRRRIFYEFLNPSEVVDLGEIIQVEWGLDSVDKVSGLVINLVRNVSENERSNYNGATGPITLKPIVVHEKNGELSWRTGQVGCAPTDAPTWCEVQPGEYYLESVFYDQADFSLLGRMMRLDPEPQVLKTIRSKNFEIIGTPNLEALKNEVFSLVMHNIAETLGVQHGRGVFNMQDFVKTNGEWQDEGDKKCLEYELVAPFSGKLRVCGNPLKRGATDFEALSPIGYASADMKDYQSAKKIAETIAHEPYLSRVKFYTQPSPEEAGYPGYDVIDFYEWSRANPDATTYLSSSLRDWYYQNEAWVFLFQVNKAGGSENGPDRFNDLVLVKVEKKGACIVEISAERSFKTNLKTDSLVCS